MQPTPGEAETSPTSAPRGAQPTGTRSASDRPAMFSRLRRVLGYLRYRGPLWFVRHSLRYLLDAVVDAWFDRRFGIATGRRMTREQLGYEDPSFHKYTPTDYLGFRRVMRELRITPADVFLDYGSGMGRVLIMAATYPFCRVFGVELSPALNRVARDNLQRALPRLACRDVMIYEQDATTFPLPDEVTVVFCYSPFSGAVLTQVMDRVEESLRRLPRGMTIVYKNSRDFDGEARRRSWIVKRSEFAHISRHPYAIYDALAERLETIPSE